MAARAAGKSAVSSLVDPLDPQSKRRTNLAKPNFGYQKRQKELEKKRKKEEKMKKKLERNAAPAEETPAAPAPDGAEQG